MAAFEGELGDYTTPDGRVVRLPSSFASTFTGLTPVSTGGPVPDAGAAWSATKPDPIQPPNAPADKTIGYVDNGRVVPAIAGPTITKLGAKDEKQFQQWVKKRGVPFDPSEKADYDMRGFWQAAQQGDPRAVAGVNTADGQVHFPDTWKTPYHKTFSNESIYATDQAPQWQGDKLVASSGKVVADETPSPDVTTDQLRKMGDAGVYNQQTRALEDASAAAKNVANTEAAQHLAMADAYHSQNEKIDNLIQKRSDDLADQQKQMQAKYDDMNQAMNKYADFKVDRSIEHPILAWLGVALSAIGAAGQNKSENPALTILMQQIDKNVQLQLAEREKLGNVVSQKKSAIDIVRQQASDRTAAYNLGIAAQIEKTKRMGDEITARSSSDIVKANWQKTRAELELKQADFLGNAVDKQHAADQMVQQNKYKEQELATARASVGVAGGHLALANKQFEYQQKKDAADLELKYNELSEKGMKDQAAALKAGAKAASEDGVYNATNGKILLQPEGEKMMNEATAFEGAAQNARAALSATTDPMKQKALQALADKNDAEAAGRRATAQATYAFTVKGEGKEKLIETVAAGQKMADVLSRVRAGIRDGSMWDRNKMAELSTLYGEAKATFGHAMGARFNEKEFETLDEILGGDPSNFKNAFNLKSGRLEARLDAAIKTTISNVSTELKGHGYRGDWKPERTDAEAAPKTAAEQAQVSLLEGKTPAEQAEGAKPGALRSMLTSDWNPIKPLATGVGRLMGRTGNPDEVAEEALNQEQSIYGLLPEQQKQLDALVSSAKPGPDGADARKSLLALVASERPAIRNAVINQLRDQNPSLYKQALSQLPADEQRVRNTPVPLAMDPLAQARGAVMAAAGVNELRANALAGDQGSKQELYRRMGLGDPAAKAAVADVIRNVGAK